MFDCESETSGGVYLPDPDSVRALEASDDDDLVIRREELVLEGIEKVKAQDLRVNFGVLVGEELFYCPYDKNHQVIWRYASHLEKCRHNYLKAVKSKRPVVKMDVCPYRPVLHHMSEFYMKRHVLCCPDREKFEKTLQAFQAVTPVPEVKREVPKNPVLKFCMNVEMEEKLKFETELSKLPDGSVFVEDNTNDNVGAFGGAAGAYNPETKLSRGFYCSKPAGLTKSEKKKHYLEESERFAAFGNKFGEAEASEKKLREH